MLLHIPLDPMFQAKAFVMTYCRFYLFNPALLRVLAAGLLASAMAVAQSASSPAEATSGYNQPPQNILDVMRAGSPPQPMVSPTHDSILLASWQDYPSIARVATPFLRLAGVRVEPGNHSKHDTPGGYGITPCATGFNLVHVADGKQVHIALPASACPGEPIWSADGKRFAFINITAESVELWVGDAATAQAHHIPGIRLNPMLNNELQWMPDQKTLLVKLIPKNLGAPPRETSAPIGPSIQESEGQKVRAVPTKRATPSTTSTTRISSTITPLPNSRWSTPPPASSLP